MISRHQNYTVPVSEDTIGTYYCHAEVSGYKTVTSRPGADVLMTGIRDFTCITGQYLTGLITAQNYLKLTI